jgi:hypothetical protein
MLPLLWKPKVHKNPPLGSVLSQMNPTYTLQPCFRKFRFNIILPSVSSAFSSRFPTVFFVRIRKMRAACPAHLILLDLIILILFRDVNKLCNSFVCSCFRFPLLRLFYMAKYSPQHPVLKHLHCSFPLLLM